MTHASSSLRRRLSLAAATLFATVSLHAQSFTGADDFSSGDDSKWTYAFRTLGNGTSNGTASYGNFQFDFTKGTGAGSYFLGGQNGVSRAASSFSTNWVADLKVTNTFVTGTNEFASIGFEIGGGSQTYSALFLSNANGALSVVSEKNTVFLNSAASAVSSDVLLRMTWDATAQQLGTYYSLDSGSSYALLNTQNLGTGLGSSATSGFYFELFASSNAAAAISVGSMSADNFSVSAVPEPSTYAAFAGALALGLAVWQRRRHATRAAR